MEQTIFKSIFLELVDIVVEQFWDQIDVSQNHSPAAVSVQAQLIEGLSLWAFQSNSFGSFGILVESVNVTLSLLIALDFFDEIDESVVLVADNLKKNYENDCKLNTYFAACEASNRNDHF